MQRLASPVPCPRGFTAVRSPGGAEWHVFRRGVAMLFPRSLPGIGPRFLVNLFLHDGTLVESWQTDDLHQLSTAELEEKFGSYAFSTAHGPFGQFRQLGERTLYC